MDSLSQLGPSMAPASAAAGEVGFESDDPASPHANGRGSSAVLAVLSAAAFMAALDLFIVNVAFASIGEDFHGASITDLSWILNGYAIIYAALLIPLGRLADRYGRKTGFMLGLAVFTLSSLGCALSPSLWPLVGFRVLQAAGAAALTPTSLGLLINAFPPQGRSRAVRIWAAVSALAAAAGPVVGGVLVQHSWRLVFLVNIPIGVVALVITKRIVPDSRDHTVTRLPDLVGSFVLAVSIGALALGLVKGPAWGWAAPATVGAFVVAAVGTAWFWWRSLHHPAPVVEPALLAVRSFAWSNAAIIAFSVAFAGNLLLAILWMQEVWHFTPMQTGFGVAPGPLMVPAFAILGGKFAKSVGVGLVTAAGCVLFAAGIALVQAFIGQAPHYFTELLPGQIVGGIGVGLALPTILSSATSGLPPVRAATGSAVINMSRQIGSVIGVSVLVALLGVTVTYSAAYEAFAHARYACAAAALMAALLALGMTQKKESVEELSGVAAADLAT